MKFFVIQIAQYDALYFVQIILLTRKIKCDTMSVL